MQKYKELQGRKFKVNSPTTILAVRGTEYAFNVEDNSTTTLIVLDGEVEFSDKQNRKGVLVKKNQQSVVKPGELPSEPLDINPDQIPKL
ncbi:MAG: FecR domain-containing protein [bacterium]